VYKIFAPASCSWLMYRRGACPSPLKSEYQVLIAHCLLHVRTITDMRSTVRKNKKNVKVWINKETSNEPTRWELETENARKLLYWHLVRLPSYIKCYASDVQNCHSLMSTIIHCHRSTTHYTWITYSQKLQLILT
jgi:hypothetical protein